MRNVLFINATTLSQYVAMPLGEGETCIDRLARYSRDLPDVVDRILIVPPDSDASSDRTDSGVVSRVASAVGARVVPLATKSATSLLQTLIAESSGADHLFYIFADCPFLDSAVTAKMFENHVRYFAEYTFADGYPYGLTPEVLRVSTLALLAPLADSDVSLDRSTIFSIVQKDINAFDIETELAPKDMRMLRLTLYCDLRRNYLLCKRLAEARAGSAEELIRVADERPELLRTLPAFVNVQIIDGCPQACSYCPFPAFGGDILSRRNGMPVERFAAIIDRVEAFAPNSTISISLWGEPSLHPQIAELIQLVERSATLSLIVETSGVGWPNDVLDSILRERLSRTTWIVSLDSMDAELYRTLRGEGFAEANATLDKLIAAFPGSVYVQGVRMVSNEAHLESFYRHFKERLGNVIIQKYDTFAGFLPDRKVTDLSPLHRFPCWHIKRDLTILLDGTVLPCREDVKKSAPWGNVFDEPLESVWERGEELYRRHVAGEYPGICAECDEYYTYNN